MASGRTSLTIKPVAGILQQLQSLYQKPSNTIRGIDDNAWFSPLQPVQPFGPPGTEPRQFQIWSGQNLIYTPRSDAEFSAADLKTLATYPLARICIENVKDTVTRAPWEIQLKPKLGETRKDTADRAKGDVNVKKLTDFFTYPDREHNWQEWLRPLLDDMLVADDASILIRKTFKGEIVETPVIRGEMIVRYIDENGFTPVPPSPAYAQNWWGLPLVNLTTDQLIYKPRNIVPRNTMSSQLYGMCFDEATEILTRDRGFVRFAELRYSDFVATRNPQTKEFEWQKPTAYIHEPYDGELYAFTSSSMDLLVTPQHRMLVSIPTKGPNGRNEKEMSAEELARDLNHERKIPVTSYWSGGAEIGDVTFPRQSSDGADVRMSGDDYCALLGAYLAEGNLSRSKGKPNGIEVNQQKQSKGFLAYSELMSRITGDQDGHNGKAFVLRRPALASHFSQFGLAHQKYVPTNVRNAPRRQLEIFWKFYHLGDGCFQKRENISGRGQAGIVRHEATTTSRRLADHLVEIAQKLGFSAHVGTKPAGFMKFSPNRKPLSFYRESYHVRCRYSTEMAVKASRKPYAGMVHCVTVPNDTVYVRRNGCPCWTKNSPTEQLAAEIQIGVKRLEFVLAYYTEGSVPGVVQVVPRGTSPDRIEEAMDWMNSQLAGNLAKRNQWRLVQGFNEAGKDDQILFPKEPLLAGLYDEKHIREIAFGYGTSPQRLMKMIRTEGKGSSDSAEIEGTLPWVLWVKGIIDFIIQKKMGLVEYEIAIDPYAEPDPLKNAAAITMLVSKAVLTPNEGRKRVGEDLRQEPEADQLGVIGGTGFVPLGMAPALAGADVDDDTKETNLAPGVLPGGSDNVNAPRPNKNQTRSGTPPQQAAGGGRSTGKNPGTPSGKESIGKKKIEKRLGSRIEPDVLTAESTQGVHKIYTAVHNAFQRQHQKAKVTVNRFHKILGNILEKRKFGNVQFNLSANDAAKVLAIEINQEDFAEKGRDLQPHTTVLFGFHPEVTAAQISSITAGIGDIPVVVQGFEAFPEGKDGIPLVMRVESDKLRKLHEDLKVLPHTDSWPDYKPHICVAYLKPEIGVDGLPRAEKYLAVGNPFEGEMFLYSELVHSGVDYTVSALEKLMLPSERIRRMEKV